MLLEARLTSSKDLVSVFLLITEVADNGKSLKVLIYERCHVPLIAGREFNFISEQTSPRRASHLATVIMKRVES